MELAAWAVEFTTMTHLSRSCGTGWFGKQTLVGRGGPCITFFSHNRDKLGIRHLTQIGVICSLQPLPNPADLHFTNTACNWREGRCYLGQKHTGWRGKQSKGEKESSADLTYYSRRKILNRHIYTERRWRIYPKTPNKCICEAQKRWFFSWIYSECVYVYVLLEKSS